MTVGIVGLGLIGGSFAMAYHDAGRRVLACDRDRSTLDFAMMRGAVDGELTGDNARECDLILLAIYPEASIEWLRQNAAKIEKNTVVIDACGTKRVVCAACFPLAEQYDFTYVGGHPMAGTHNSGFKYARGDLYRGAPMVIVPPVYDDIELLDRVKGLLSPAGFGAFHVTTAEKHDEIIAFTSQMAHVVSNAYIKSPTARSHKGVSAGSYKDLTRVAWLNPQMWAELFLENKDNLLHELDVLIASLQQYREALTQDDMPRLIALLDEGRRIKEEVDGR
ncbi:MAG: prephenate dehydrogenase [Oscillospiraceae bacterium]|nr:prephenate dehydrogenase [Oscillospiraceae bacterium]